MSYIKRVLSRPVAKPYRTDQLPHDEAPFLDNNGNVGFAPGDVENPHNWSKGRRVFITISAVMLVMNATFASSSPSGCFPSISEDFGVSMEVAGLTITLFLLGYCAGPLIFAPLSEMYGRRWVFYITFTLYNIFNFLCAWAPNFGALLVGRFITGTFVSAPLSNAPGVVADLWGPMERGNAMAGFAVMVYLGPALGPVIAGFLQLKKSWEWSFYVLLWLGGATELLMFTIPETHGPTILRHKAQRIRKAKIPGYENVKSPIEQSGQTLVAVYKVALTRPWLILFDTISFLCAIYMAVVYTLLYMLFSIYPIVFQEKRGWNSGVGELPLIGTIVGAFIGGAIVLADTHRRTSKIKKGEKKLEDFEAEDRLFLGMIGGIGFAITMFGFAWSAEYNSVHWFVPTMFGSLLAASLLLVFVGFLNYIVDVYLMYAASAIAANTIARSACGAAAPLFTHQMFDALGVGGGGSLVGGVATVLAIIPFMFYKYGKQIRMKSKFAPHKRNQQEKEKDEERDPTEYNLQGPRRNSAGSDTAAESDTAENAIEEPKEQEGIVASGGQSGERHQTEQ